MPLLDPKGNVVSSQKPQLAVLPGPNATPGFQLAQTQERVPLMVVYGGLTKLEWMAGMIASGDPNVSPHGAKETAMAILKACNE